MVIDMLCCHGPSCMREQQRSLHRLVVYSFNLVAMEHCSANMIRVYITLGARSTHKRVNNYCGLYISPENGHDRENL